MGQLSIELSYLRSFDCLPLITIRNSISFVALCFVERLIGCAEVLLPEE